MIERTKIVTLYANLESRRTLLLDYISQAPIKMLKLSRNLHRPIEHANGQMSTSLTIIPYPILEAMAISFTLYSLSNWPRQW